VTGTERTDAHNASTTFMDSAPLRAAETCCSRRCSPSGMGRGGCRERSSTRDLDPPRIGEGRTELFVGSRRDYTRQDNERVRLSAGERAIAPVAETLEILYVNCASSSATCAVAVLNGALGEVRAGNACE
jgi:hypothetical protein